MKLVLAGKWFSNHKRKRINSRTCQNHAAEELASVFPIERNLLILIFKRQVALGHYYGIYHYQWDLKCDPKLLHGILGTAPPIGLKSMSFII